MKTGMLVKVKPNHESAGNLGLILECHTNQSDKSYAYVYWADGSTYWYATEVLEEITKSDKKCPPNT
jgi:hypothetical protein